MKLSALAPFALTAALSAPIDAKAQQSHTGRINAIAEHYDTLKQISHTEGYWQIMRAARLLNNPQINGSIARANLFMNEIADGTYDNNVRAQAELTICAGKDIGYVMYVIRGNNELLTNMGRTAANASYMTQSITRAGNIQVQSNCATVLNRRVR